MITLGFTSGVDENFIDQVLRGLREAFPDRTFHVDLSSMDRSVSAFTEHNIDILIFSDYSRLSHNLKYSCRTAYMTQFCILLFRSSPLFGRAELQWEDLDRRVLILPPYLASSVAIADLDKKLRQHRIQMDIRYRDSDFASILKFIRVNGYLTVGPLQLPQPDDMRYLPIRGLEYPFVIACHRDDAGRLEAYTDRLYETLRALHRKQEPVEPAL